MAPEYPLTPEVSVDIGDGVRRIVAGNAGLMTGPGTNTYVLGESELLRLAGGTPVPGTLFIPKAGHPGPGYRWAHSGTQMAWDA